MIAQQTTEETLKSLEKAKTPEIPKPSYETHQGRLLVNNDLHLAALQALKGKAGFKRGLLYLKEVSQINPNIVHNPLYQALYWEFSAYEGKAPKKVIEGALMVAKAQDSLSCYHAARALFAAGSLETVLTVLDSVEIADLSQQIKPRYHSLLGKTHQSLGQFTRAAKAFEQAVQLSQGSKRQGMLLNLASCWFEANQILNSLNTLASIELEALSESEQANFHLIKGQIALKQGDMETAFNELLTAQSLGDSFENALEINLSLAQSCVLIGKPQQASTYFQKALKEAKECKSFVEHEYAFALMSEGSYLEAKTLLEDVIKDDTYDMQSQALADLGEVNYRLGFLTEAESYAEQALEQGEGLHSCFLLGQIACNYYQHDKAIEYFEKALSETKQGDKNWLLAHTMIADTLVKQGFNEPNRIALHTKKALSYTPRYEAWHTILQGYANKAKEMLGGYSRVVN